MHCFGRRFTTLDECPCDMPCELSIVGANQLKDLLHKGTRHTSLIMRCYRLAAVLVRMPVLGTVAVCASSLLQVFGVDAFLPRT